MDQKDKIILQQLDVIRSMTENGITFRFVTYINNKHCDAHIPINPQHLPL